MTPEQIKLARHALGLPNTWRRSYRNHYVVGEYAPEHALWMALVEAGDARHRSGKGHALTGGDDVFWLTRQGATKALKRGERLCPEDFPAPEETQGC